ncbi:CAP domain-containing protein [Nannocystis bainbridge]|uniref:CAP domain-containing protein n=1 Tax=Nannocystis bainbridge TaxID=2995303 RepID=A0ABT5EBQ1_9BACT|nr:CAP domain-containing protein [Nannocystis bainbridge]MDC0723296.1 CAP domain-containing protein [Nannocystis bainbridge]
MSPRSSALLLTAALACRPDLSKETASPPVRDPAGPRSSSAAKSRPASTSAPAPARAPEPGRLAGITAAHNRHRAQLDIAALTWSPELARYAQAWADKLKRRGCDLEHRPRSGPDAQRHGENLFYAGGQAATAEQVVDAWVAEVAGYDARTGRCRGVCGHYTQVVWRDSQRIGCGVASCGESEVWVCNYDPPGNFLGQKPY